MKVSCNSKSNFNTEQIFSRIFVVVVDVVLIMVVSKYYTYKIGSIVSI